jgi:hypothetical protein
MFCDDTREWQLDNHSAIQAGNRLWEQLPASLGDKPCTRTQTVDGLGSDIEQLHYVGLNKHASPLTLKTSKGVPITHSKMFYKARNVHTGQKAAVHATCTARYGKEIPESFPTVLLLQTRRFLA